MSGELYIDIGRIHLAHEYVLDRVHRCAYPRGREVFGLVLAIEGNAEYRFVTGEHLTVAPGDVLFLSAGVAYTIVTERAFGESVLMTFLPLTSPLRCDQPSSYTL